MLTDLQLEMLRASATDEGVAPTNEPAKRAALSFLHSLKFVKMTTGVVPEGKSQSLANRIFKATDKGREVLAKTDAAGAVPGYGICGADME